MRFCLFNLRCQCKEEFSFPKLQKSRGRSEGRVIEYPKTHYYSKTFEIKYNTKLSAKAKFILKSFRHKFIYYAMDDLLYLLKLNTSEKENLLTLLYSPILSLHNNLYINFFDIWISEIYITEIVNSNRFLKASEECQPLTHITLNLIYKTSLPFKKLEPIW